MTFLELARRTAQECGVATGQALTSAVPSVSTSIGSVARLVNWVADSWTDIQMFSDQWDWMRSSNVLGQGVSFQTIAGQTTYLLGTDPGTVGVAADSFARWDMSAFRVQTTAISYRDETFLDEIDYDLWRNGYMLGAMRDEKTRPVAIAIGPGQSLNLGPPPNGLYTVTGDYFLAPSELVNDADVPLGLPTRFHMLVVYGAMQKYGFYEAANEIIQRGRNEASVMMTQLLADRGPMIRTCGALA